MTRFLSPRVKFLFFFACIDKHFPECGYGMLLGQLFSSRIKLTEMDGLITGMFQRRNISLSLKTPTSLFE